MEKALVDKPEYVRDDDWERFTEEQRYISQWKEWYMLYYGNPMTRLLSENGFVPECWCCGECNCGYCDCRRCAYAPTCERVWVIEDR